MVHNNKPKSQINARILLINACMTWNGNMCNDNQNRLNFDYKHIKDHQKETNHNNLFWELTINEHTMHHLLRQFKLKV